MHSPSERVMVMQYEEALKRWGANRIQDWYPASDIDWESVHVAIEFNEGFACCGGSNPDCYCSYAESPSASVVITGSERRVDIAAADFDFAVILGEIVDVAGGTVKHDKQA